MEIPKVLPDSFPFLSKFHVGILVNKPILFIILGVYFFVYVILAGVLFYHWFAYGMRSRGIVVAQTLFFIVSVVLFVSAGLSAFYY
jgi:hypothetical protein